MNAQTFVADLEKVAYDRTLRAEVVKLMASDHRTHQQSFMRFFTAFCEEMAKNSTDARNENSVKLAKEVIASKNACLPYI